MTITQAELKYILYSGVFAVVYFLFLLKPLEAMFTDPFAQFLIFNIGIFAVFFIFLKGFALKARADAQTSLGLLLMFIAFDLVMPEFHVTIAGELVKGAELGASTSDYVIGSIAQSVGLSGIFVYIATYIIAPILLLYITAKLLPNFVARL